MVRAGERRRASHARGSAVLQSIIDGAATAGYVAEGKELNSVNYGVPQVRRRIFVIGNRLGLPIDFPSPTHGANGLPFLTVRDAISDLPPLTPGADTSEHEYRRHAVASAYQNAMRGHNGAVDGNCHSEFTVGD